jgi:hypothetical protein
MKLEELKTIEQLSQFLDGTQAVIFKITTVKKERYDWIRHELVRFDYLKLGKSDKGIIIRYLMKVSGYSRQQITRLIKQYRKTGYIKHFHANVPAFQKKCTPADIRLIAKMDERYDSPCGQTIKKLCERAYRVFDEQEFERLSTISVSHLYNLRKSTTYCHTRQHFEKTKPNQSVIGERRKPKPEGQPGFIRIDTVHQGDQDKKKGVYHINAVDEETQFEVVATIEKISEYFLIPVLEQMLESFPFKLISFHSDNGSEYINKNVAELLEKLLIEFTKSRSRHSNDNALAESKNASIVRKTLGYKHIPQKYAELINQFDKEFLNPHINFHRPCFFPVITTDEKGKQHKKYPYQSMMTPYEKLKSLPKSEQYLKDGVTFEIMDEIAYAITDNKSADQLQKARQQLFKTIDERELNTG